MGQSKNFYPRAPGGARHCPPSGHMNNGTFLSACPGRGTTAGPTGPTGPQGISIRVPREGHDFPRCREPGRRKYFYPRAPGGARQGKRNGFVVVTPISIRVPREGHDPGEHYQLLHPVNFYPRAPGGARLVAMCSPPSGHENFYPRAPGGARPLSAGCSRRPANFYPRAPGGARRIRRCRRRS